MKKVLKNILFVSYLKNKGVRRICFVLGVLFGVICFLDLHYEFKHIKLSYQSLEQAVQDNKYNRDVLERIYEAYPVKFNFGKSFYEWNDFFTGYDRKYNTIISLCQKKQKGEENTTSKPWEEYQSSYQKKQKGEEEKYPSVEICNELKSYVFQPVKIVNWNKLYDIKWVVFWFYFPFLFCLPFKWIYRGFKEKA